MSALLSLGETPTWTSHFSTAPLASEGLIRVLKGTSSPSTLIMPVMSVLGWNLCSRSKFARAKFSHWMPMPACLKNYAAAIVQCLQQLVDTPLDLHKEVCNPTSLSVQGVKPCSCASWYDQTHCSLSMPSKHFLRCGCTRVGSLVSLRISSISSLDRKKKRGKAKRLSSR